MILRYFSPQQVFNEPAGLPSHGSYSRLQAVWRKVHFQSLTVTAVLRKNQYDGV